MPTGPTYVRFEQYTLPLASGLIAGLSATSSYALADEKEGLGLACHLAKASAKYQKRLHPDAEPEVLLRARVAALRQFYGRCGFLGLADAGVHSSAEPVLEAIGHADFIYQVLAGCDARRQDVDWARVVLNKGARQCHEDALLAVLYRAAAGAVGRLPIARCQARDCQALFFVTHAAEQFCPPWPGRRESQCAQRSYRRRRKAADDCRTIPESRSSMPNTISSLELADLKLVRVGAICPVGQQCEPQIDQVTTCVLYAQVVDGRVKKFGSAADLYERMKRNSNTINQILEFQDGRSRSRNKKITDPSTYDKFKQQAPGVIRDGREIEVWATSRCSRDACKDPNKGCDGQCADCIALERSLNARYETILCGWAARLT